MAPRSWVSAISSSWAKKAGKANVTWKIDKLGLPALDSEQVDKLTGMVKEKATEIKGVLSDDDFKALYESMS